MGLAVGIVAGLLIDRLDPATAAKVASWIRPFGQLFLRLIRMIIAPLVFSTLVAGVAGAGHFKVVGRMGLRAILYFEAVTTLALVIGLVTVNVLKPGVGVVLAGRDGADGGGAADVGSDPAARGAGVGDRRHGARATSCRSSSSA